MLSIQILPNNVLMNILSNLTPKCIQNLSTTNKYFYNLLKETDFLKNLYQIQNLFNLHGFIIKKNSLQLYQFLYNHNENITNNVQLAMQNKLQVLNIYCSSTDFDQHIDNTNDLTPNSRGSPSVHSSECTIHQFSEGPVILQNIIIQFYQAEYLKAVYFYPKYIKFTFFLNQNQITYESENIPFSFNIQDKNQKCIFQHNFPNQNIILAKYVKIEFIQKNCLQETDNQFYIAVQTILFQGIVLTKHQKFQQLIDYQISDYSQQIYQVIESLGQKNLDEIATTLNQNFELIGDKRVYNILFQKNMFNLYFNAIQILFKRDFATKKEIYYFLKLNIQTAELNELLKIETEHKRVDAILKYFSFLDTITACVLDKQLLCKWFKSFFKIMIGGKKKLTDQQQILLYDFINHNVTLQEKTIYVYNYHLKKSLSMLVIALKKFLC